MSFSAVWCITLELSVIQKYLNYLLFDKFLSKKIRSCLNFYKNILKIPPDCYKSSLYHEAYIT